MRRYDREQGNRRRWQRPAGYTLEQLRADRAVAALGGEMSDELRSLHDHVSTERMCVGERFRPAEPGRATPLGRLCDRLPWRAVEVLRLQCGVEYGALYRDPPRFVCPHLVSALMGLLRAVQLCPRARLNDGRYVVPIRLHGRKHGGRIQADCIYELGSRCKRFNRWAQFRYNLRLEDGEWRAAVVRPKG